MTARDVVLAFWEAMGTNDFVRASEWLSPDFEGFWPQSHELISGRANFACINTVYPVNGAWRFCVNAVVCEGNTVVTDVSVTDGTTSGRAITFHTVENGLIRRQREFWPDDFPTPPWRADMVSIVDVDPLV